MAKELNEDTGFTVSIKTLGGIGVALATVIGMWFTLQADIAEAKELPLLLIVTGKGQKGEDSFKKMYGKNAQFIDVENTSQVAKTINNLLLNNTIKVF